MKKILFILSVCAFLTACHTVPPAVIGQETQQGLLSLQSEVTTLATQAEVIDSGVDTIADDVDSLAKKAPESLQDEIKAIQVKIAAVAGLTEKQKTVTVPEVQKTVTTVQASVIEDMGKTAQLADEKNHAEKGELKAQKTNVILGSVLILMIAGGVVGFLLKLRRVI